MRIRSFPVHVILALACTAFLAGADPSTTVSTGSMTTAASPITFTIDFSAPVKGLTPAELALGGVGGTIVGLSSVSASDGYATRWLAAVQPASEGTITFQVPAEVATTAASDGNQLSNLITVRYDTPPALTITTPVVTASEITFRIAFDEDWTVADAGQITVTGAVIDSKTVVAGPPAVYEVVVTPWGNGSVRLAVGAGAFADTDGTSDANAAGGLTYAFGSAPDGTQASVSRVRFLSATDHSYKTGEAIDLEVVFTRPVLIKGPPGSEPALLLNAKGSNPTPARARYVAVDGAAVRFRYTVAAGNYTPSLDYTSTSALTIGSQGAIVGDDDFLARTTLAKPGAQRSLRGSGAVGVNYTAPKPAVGDVSGPDNVDVCGAGSAIGLLLTAGLLLAFARNRRR